MLVGYPAKRSGHETLPEYKAGDEQGTANLSATFGFRRKRNSKAGVCNTGFWGMHFETDSTYTLRVWVKASAKFNGKYTDNSSRMMELLLLRKCSWKAL